MKLFKCYHCTNAAGVPGRDFEAAKAVCPDCKLDATAPHAFGLIVERATIHFQPPAAVGFRQSAGNRACDGKPVVSGMATPEPSIVNCKACRDSEVFAAVLEERGDSQATETRDYPHGA